MRRYLTLAAIAAIGLAGCAGDGGAESASVADITAEPAEGLTIESQECELDTALDYFDPEGVEAGVVDACHVKTSGPNYTLYGYAEETGAIAAMLSWGTGIIGSAPFTQQEQATTIEAGDMGDDALALVSSDLGITRVVARKGNYVIQVTADTEADGREIATEIMGRIPDGAVPAAPAE